MTALRQRLGPNAARVVAVSTLVLAAVLILIVISGSGGTYTVKANFDDVRGLIPGAPVRAAAVPVGAVEKVELGGKTAVVTMKIDEDYVLHEGSVADIELFSNAGAVNRTIEVTSGDPTKPKLKPGSTLSGPQTDQPVNFDDAAETLDEPTRANIKRFLIGLDTALKGRGRDFDQTLRSSSEAVNETANLIAQVNSDGESLKVLVRQGSKVTGALAASPGDLGSAADRTAALLAVTGRRQAELSRSVQLLGPSLDRGQLALASLAASAPRLRQLVANLAPVADELGPFARALPPALKNAGPFLEETRGLVRQGPGDLRDFRPIIDSAHKVSDPLAGLVTKVLPLGNALRAYVPETVGFFQNLGSTLGSYDANGHILNLAGGFYQAPPASATARENGPGDCGAGLLRLPFTRVPGVLECQPWPNYSDSYIDVPKKKAGKG